MKKMVGQKMFSYDQMSLVHISLFKILGMLPHEGDGNNTSFFRKTMTYYIPVIYFHIMNTIYYTMFLGYGIRMLYQLGYLDVDFICEMVVVQGLYIRYLMFCLRQQDLLSLIKFCKDLWSFVRLEETGFIRGFERKVYYLRQFFLWNCLLLVTFYIMTAQYIRITSMDENGTTTKILSHKFYVDVQDDNWYIFVSILQGTVCYTESFVLTGVETVGPFLIMMACGYLRIVQNRLYSMTRSPKDYSMEVESHDFNIGILSLQEITICLQFHQKILEFCEKIDRFMRSLFMVQVSTTIYNMSFIGIKLLENDENIGRYLSLFFLNLLQCFTCEWISEHLLNESEAIANAAYSATMSHENYEHNANFLLLFITLRAQKPILLTAGGIFKLSLESFKDLMVNAFSFFTVLRGMNE